MELSKLLEEVSKGKISVQRARETLDSVLAKASQKLASHPDKAKESTSESTGATDVEKLRQAFETLLQQVRSRENLHEVVKGAGDLFTQLKDVMPSQLGRLRENVSQNLQLFGVPPNARGINSKVSLFKNLEMSEDSTIEENEVVGSQWISVHFIKTTEAKKNYFAASQLTDVNITQSDFNSNSINVSRLSHMNLQESRFESNRGTRMVLADFKLVESDFTHNKLVKSEFVGTTVNGSRFSELDLRNTEFRECEFDSCDMQGLQFVNCYFEECVFRNIELKPAEKFIIENRKVAGRNIDRCSTVEEFLRQLDDGTEERVERPTTPQNRKSEDNEKMDESNRPHDKEPTISRHDKKSTHHANTREPRVQTNPQPSRSRVIHEEKPHRPRRERQS